MDRPTKRPIPKHAAKGRVNFSDLAVERPSSGTGKLRWHREFRPSDGALVYNLTWFEDGEIAFARLRLPFSAPPAKGSGAAERRAIAARLRKALAVFKERRFGPFDGPSPYGTENGAQWAVFGRERSRP